MPNSCYRCLASDLTIVQLPFRSLATRCITDWATNGPPHSWHFSLWLCSRSRIYSSSTGRRSEAGVAMPNLEKDSALRGTWCRRLRQSVILTKNKSAGRSTRPALIILHYNSTLYIRTRPTQNQFGKVAGLGHGHHTRHAWNTKGHCPRGTIAYSSHTALAG